MGCQVRFLKILIKNESATLPSLPCLKVKISKIPSKINSKSKERKFEKIIFFYKTTQQPGNPATFFCLNSIIFDF
jgi:hypothetical protein